MDDSMFSESPSDDGRSHFLRAPASFASHQSIGKGSMKVCTVVSKTSLNRMSDDDDDDEIADEEVYRRKYRKLKKVAKGLIFENACLCDEVSQLQEKIVIAKEERRFLLRKLLYFEAQKEKDANAQANLPASLAGGSSYNKSSAGEITDSLKKKNPPKKKQPSKAVGDKADEATKSRSKKKKVPSEKKEKRLVPPIPLDCSGRPVFPIMLGALTVHSLGVIIHDRLAFHDENTIYPVGYCSSRMYMSLKNPPHQCLYTCTVMDSSFGPRFEVTPEDNPEHQIVSTQLNECHSYLLRSINILCGREILNTEGQGAKFFGLTHPVVQNLIQSCAGARKCSHYRWVQFEVSKPKPDEDVKQFYENDPTVNYDVLRNLLSEC